MIRVIIKIGMDHIVEIKGNHSEVEVSTDKIIGKDNMMSMIIEMTLKETILEKCKNYRSQNFRGGYRRNYRNDNYGRGRIRSRGRQYSGNFS